MDTVPSIIDHGCSTISSVATCKHVDRYHSKWLATYQNTDAIAFHDQQAVAVGLAN